MEDIYSQVTNFLGHVLLTGGGAAAVAFLVFRLFSERWLQSKFDEKLEAFRHENAKELQQFKLKADGVLDAKIRFQQKQFEVISVCWSGMNEALGAVQELVNPFQHYEDIGAMSLPLRKEYVEKLDLFEAQKQEILDSEDPTESLIEAQFWRRYNSAANLIRDFGNKLYLNQIYLDGELFKKFEAIKFLMRQMLISKKMSKQVAVSNCEETVTSNLERCDEILNDISFQIRSRFDLA